MDTLQRDITTKSSKLGGWTYPIMERFCAENDWYIISTPVEMVGVRNPEDSKHKPSADDVYSWFGYYNLATDDDAFRPTLRWVNGSTVVDLYVRNSSEWMTTSDFLAITGIELNLDNGGFVASKRISRLMRRYIAYGFYKEDKINVRYMEQGKRDAMLWDGAGIISRKFLNKLVRQLNPQLDARKHAKIRNELRNCSRVEFTLMTSRGQDKGHAAVSDDLDCDLLLPMDTKTSIRMVDIAMIGVNFVHGHDNMRLDVQSLINLYPFFSVDYMLHCVREEGELFAHAIESGEKDLALNKIEGLRENDITDWWIMEYFASQGKAMWFASVTKGLMNQHIKRLVNTTAGKLRVPVHGGRYYIMTEAIARSAGYDIRIERGHVLIDDAAMWVNDDDWCDYIASVTGGADQDDAYWVHPFIDTDGTTKMLCWRSPNQPGEYIILTPTENSHTPTWNTVNGEAQIRSADSSVLPTRIDQQQQTYLDLVDETTAGGLGEGMGYSVDAMELTIERTRANAGVLGWYCNLIMVQHATHSAFFDIAPAPLEDIIDSSVKTGADLSAVKAWCNDFVETWQDAIPAYLIDRLNREAYTLTDGHWLDTLNRGLESHIAAMHERSAHLAGRTVPPLEVIRAGAKYMDKGGELRREYGRAFIANTPITHQLEEAQQNTLSYLSQYSPTEQSNILLGAICHVYTTGKDVQPSDSVLWQPEIAPLTMDALRSVNVLTNVIVTPSGQLKPQFDVQVQPTQRLRVTNIWFNALKAQGKTTAAYPGQVNKALAKSAKAKVTSWVLAGAFNGKEFTVAAREDRQVLVNDKGVVVGYIAKAQTGAVETSKRIIVQVAQDDFDGNLLIIAA